MRKLVNIIIIMAVLFSILTVIIWADSYTTKAVCISVSGKTVELLDIYTGNLWLWEMEEGESFTSGNLYKVMIYKGQLQSYEDDIIINIKEAK